MKKPSALAEMIAKKIFHSPKVFKSWQMHMRFEAPVLEAAYQECYSARVHINNILNQIGRDDAAGATKSLDQLIKFCGCDTAADKALVCYLQAKYCMAKRFAFSEYEKIHASKKAALKWYIQTGHHRPDLFDFLYRHYENLAFDTGHLDIALAAHVKKLARIRPQPEMSNCSREKSDILCEIGRCLTHMHRYEEAERYFNQARKVYYCDSIEIGEIVTFAAQGKKAEVAACIAALEKVPFFFVDWLEAYCDVDAQYTLGALGCTPDTVNLASFEEVMYAILERRNAYFYPQPVNESAITAFWWWFRENEPSLLALYRQRGEELPEAFVHSVTAQLEPCFPFKWHLPLEIEAQEDGVKPKLCFIDRYNRSLTAGYSKLIAACPADIASRWKFVAVH